MTATDIERYLDPISEDSPSGEDMEYDPLFGEMERSAEGKQEQQFGDTVIPAEDPDWRVVKKNTEAVLALSKDLRAAILFSQASLHTDGFEGLSSGLSITRCFIETYWDSAHPQLDPDDDNDPLIRINTLLNLCDSSAFLNVISQTPLVSSKVLGKFSLRDIQILEGVLPTSDDTNSDITLDQIEGAFKESTKEDLRAVLGNITHSIECIEAIEEALNQRVGIAQSPSLEPIVTILRHAGNEITKRTGEAAIPAAGTAAEEQSSDGGAVQAVEANVVGSIQNRDDVIRTLERLCQYYEQNEPSSPVPLLLIRAKNLVKKGFLDIIQDLAPEGSTHFDFLDKQ
jgi:type VI secretion system protein ImpA